MLPTKLCGACPQIDENLYINPILKEATLTFSLNFISKKNSALHYRITFSDGPIALEFPLLLTEVTSWLTMDLKGYKKGSDFDYSLKYREES
jgi:hypothetical protein